MWTSNISLSPYLPVLLRPLLATLFLVATAFGVDAAEGEPKPDDPNAITIVINSVDGAPSMANPLLVRDRADVAGLLGIRINGHVCGYSKGGDEEIWSPCLWRKGVCVCNGR